MYIEKGAKMANLEETVKVVEAYWKEHGIEAVVEACTEPVESITVLARCQQFIGRSLMVNMMFSANVAFPVRAEYIVDDLPCPPTESSY